MGIRAQKLPIGPHSRIHADHVELQNNGFLLQLAPRHTSGALLT
jgi:hypothetical protein